MRDVSPVLALLSAALFSLGLQQLGVVIFVLLWPQTGAHLGGQAAWILSAPVLAACIGLLVGAWHAGQFRGRLSRDGLLVLTALPLLLALGTVAAGFAQIAADHPYLPSRWLVPNLLGVTYRMFTPVTGLALAVLGPLWLLCWWGGLRRARALGLGGALFVGSLLWLCGQRAVLFKAAKDLMIAESAGLAAELQLPGVALQWVGLVGLGIVLWALPSSLPRVGRWLWLGSALLLVDPVPVVFGWFLPPATVEEPGRLIRLQGRDVRQGGALVDLTGEELRLDGRVVDLEGLGEELQALGYADLGERVPAVSQLSNRTWGDRVRSAVRLAAPGAARVGELQEVFQRLSRHGIGDLHWVGQVSEPVEGPLARAFRQPSFTILMDVPLDEVGEILVPWAWIDEGGAELVDPAERCTGVFRGPGWREALDGALQRCGDGVLVLPSSSLSVESLFFSLDRLGGTGRVALGPFRVGLVPPGPSQAWFRQEQQRLFPDAPPDRED